VVLRDVTIEYVKDDPALKAEHRPLPAWGLTARNLNQFCLENVRLRSVEAQTRPAIILEKVRAVTIDGYRSTPHQGEGAAIVMNEVGSRDLRDVGWPPIQPTCNACG